MILEGGQQEFTSPGEALEHYRAQAIKRDGRQRLIRGSAQKPFASPEEALAHYGVKGMRWGVRKEYESVARDAGGRISTVRLSPEARQQALVNVAIGSPIGTDFSSSTKNNASSTTKNNAGERDGLTTNQKRALVGLGVVAAAGAGYLAYSHYKGEMFFPGGKKPLEWDVSDLKNKPLSDIDFASGGSFSSKYPSQALARGTAGGDIRNFYNIDTAKGYANYIPKGGYDSEFAKARHQDLMDTFDEMRAKYPSVRNLKVEMVPMSEVPGLGSMQVQGAIAAVMPLGKGEARIMYNDKITDFGGASKEAVEAFVPGMFKDKYVGYHEMGHILAVANGDMPPLGKLLTGKQITEAENFRDVTDFFKSNIMYGASSKFYHKRTFKKHGFSFEELSKLGEYAATQPAESMAELFGHYAHPEMRTRLTPKQLSRAEKMFNEMGGLT